MPLVIHPRIRKGLRRVAALTAGLLATTAVAAHAACVEPALTQPFLSWNDQRFYTLAPGQEVGDFTGNGWALSGGATIVTAPMADGATRRVLDLPSGSRAVSPTMCVSSAYPIARMQVRNVVGAEGVYFHVSYLNTKTWDKPKNTGQVHGTGKAWTLSGAVNLQPYKTAGWQQVRFTFIPGGTKSDFQLYDFYVDPYRH